MIYANMWLNNNNTTSEKIPLLISSGSPRVRSTIKIANQAHMTKMSLVGTFQNSWERTFANLFWLSSKETESMKPELDAEIKSLSGIYPNANNLTIQDLALQKFLQGNFQSSDAYTLAKKRLKLLINTIKNMHYRDFPVTFYAMRHWHREWEDLTPQWEMEAKNAGERDFKKNYKLLIWTHQWIIESLLISLVWGISWLTPQEAWNQLPDERKVPYKTAQVTEFTIEYYRKGDKILYVTTNWHTSAFALKDMEKAYENIKKHYANCCTDNSIS